MLMSKFWKTYNRVLLTRSILPKYFQKRGTFSYIRTWISKSFNMFLDSTKICRLISPNPKDFGIYTFIGKITHFAVRTSVPEWFVGML